MYKHKDCFFYLFFLSRWKGSETSRGNLRWFPLDPLSTSDRGSAPLGRPCSMGRVSTSGRVLCECTARATFHRRATVDAGRQGLRFSSGFWFGRGCRRCGAKVELFNTARAESERVLKPKNLPGAESWPNTEILAGKGSGYQPPTAALG